MKLTHVTKRIDRKAGPVIVNAYNNHILLHLTVDQYRQSTAAFKAEMKWVYGLKYVTPKTARRMRTEMAWKE